MFKVAWRNLWRNRTRTIISVSAIALSYAMFLVSIGLADASYTQMEDAAADAAGGSVLVHGDGYWDTQLNDIVIPDAEPVAEAIAAVPGVEGIARRVLVNGLLSTSSGSVATRVQGVHPDEEARLQNAARFVSEGTFLTGDEADPLVLGRGIVDELDLELGDRVVMTATDTDGEMRRALFHLTGIIDTGMKSLDDFAAYTTVSAAQKAVGMEGSLTQIGIIAPRETRFAVKTSVLEAIDGNHRLEVLTWDEAMPDMVGMIQLDAAFGDIYGLIVFVVVVFAVMNTFLMIVMERIREFGLLSAIGLKPTDVAKLLLSESFLLALVSIAIGFSLGFSIHLYLSIHGVDIMAIYGTELDFGGVSLTDTIIRSEINTTRWINATLMVFALTMLSSAYPAYKAARMTPAEAMRFFH